MNRWDLFGAACVLAFVASLGSWLFLREEVPAEDAQLVDPTAEIQLGHEWLGLYFKGQKIGLLHLEKRARAGGGFDFDLHTKMHLLALHTDSALELRVRAQLDSGLTLESFDFEVDAGLADLSGRGVVEGKTVRMRIITGGEPVERSVELAHPPVLRSNLGPVLSRQTLEPGSRFRYHAFDPLSQADQPIDVEVIGPDMVTALGHEVPATHIRQTVGGLQLDAWINQRGEMLRQDLGLGITARRESEQEARWGLVQARTGRSTADLVEATMIEVSDLPDSLAKANRLRVGLKGVDLKGYALADRRQRFERGVLTVEKEQVGVGLGLPVAEAPEGSLEATALVQSDHPKIRGAARRAAGGAKDSLSAARALASWVGRTVKRQTVAGVPSALETLEARVGDCNEHSTLFAAMGRAVGIPTRIVSGLVFDKGRFGYHAWNEVLTADGWLSVDVTWDQMPVDVGHLRFVTGGLERQVDLLRLLGRLRIRALSVEPGGD